MRPFWRGWLAAVAALGCAASFAPARAVDIDPSQMTVKEIKALEPIDRVPRMLQAPELTDGLPFPTDEVEHV